MTEHAERKHNFSYKKEQRQQLRNHSTSAEASLWTYLQQSQLGGRKFRRQHGVGPYIVDFYCPAEKLVVELDGAGHYDVVGNARDVERTQYLEAQGLQVLRFENNDFWNHPESVLAAIEAAFSTGAIESLSRPVNHP